MLLETKNLFPQSIVKNLEADTYSKAEANNEKSPYTINKEALKEILAKSKNPVAENLFNYINNDVLPRLEDLEPESKLAKETKNIFNFVSNPHTFDPEIQTFTNEKFGNIRLIEIDGEPWFVGKDVAKMLGYKDSINALKSHADPDDKRGWQITTPGGKQKITIINESGLYSLIMKSKLPEAKEFKHWVTHEVLPAIRKHGSYMTETHIMPILPPFSQYYKGVNLLMIFRGINIPLWH